MVLYRNDDNSDDNYFSRFFIFQKLTELRRITILKSAKCCKKQSF